MFEFRNGDSLSRATRGLLLTLVAGVSTSGRGGALGGLRGRGGLLVEGEQYV